VEGLLGKNEATRLKAVARRLTARLV
jgi:hypothetical protein